MDLHIFTIKVQFQKSKNMALTQIRDEDMAKSLQERTREVLGPVQAGLRRIATVRPSSECAS